MMLSKNKAEQKLENLQTLTKIVIAYFVNECDRNGLSFNNRKITNKKHIIAGEFINPHLYPFVKGEWLFKFDAKVKDIANELDKKGYLEKLFKDEIKPQIESQVMDSIHAFKAIDNNLHIGFFDLPDCIPFVTCFVKDMEDKVKFRGIAGNLIFSNEIGLIFDAHCYLVKEDANENDKI